MFVYEGGSLEQIPDAFSQTSSDIEHLSSFWAWFDELDHKPAVDLQILSVDRDPAAFAQVADHVPVHRGVVLPARLGIGHPHRQMDRAADLLVQQDLLGEAVDAVVGADPELAQAASPVVRVERLDQELLVALGGGVHDLPVLEAQPHSGHLAARRTRRDS